MKPEICKGTSFCKVSSCTEKMGALTIQEAMIEAAIKARGLGYNFLLFLSNSKRSVLVSNRIWRPNWQERILLDDWSNLVNSNLVYHSVHVPKVVIRNVSFLAKLANKMPI